MTQRVLLSILFAGALGALAADARAASASETDAQVKALGQRYNQVEAQLARSLHYQKKETAGDGATTTEQAWFNGGGDLLKVATERSDAAGGRELTEWIALSFDNPQLGLFVLNRKESPLPEGGGTGIEESRKYYGYAGDGNGVLIRELRKSAKFRAGESLDTVKTPNTVVDLARQPKLDPSTGAGERALREFLLRPGEIAEALQKAGPPAADPFAGDGGDRERFRVIRGSASPDGRYAVAIGFTKPVNWEEGYRDAEFTDAQIYTADEDDEDLRNYVVELITGRILGETGCKFFGTRHSYNHRECSVSWSPDSTWFVELTEVKWGYVACRAGHIVAGPKLLGCPDVGKFAEKAAATFLAGRSKRRLRDSSIAISEVSVNNDGVIELTLLGQQASGERKGEVDFSTDQRLRLRPSQGGKLSLETLSVRPTPKE